jgi:hypothetical protein
MAAGSWSLAEDLFARGDAIFVAELRKVHQADRLGAFAAQWLADPRPFARQTLFEYLSQPLNCYRHEPLVKRLFKLAEKLGDDEMMGAFLVAFDRTIRRQRRTKTRYKHESFSSQAAAAAALRNWEAEGYGNARTGSWNAQFYVTAWKQEEVGDAGQHDDAAAGQACRSESAHRRTNRNREVDSLAGHASRMVREEVPSVLTADAALSEAAGLALLPQDRQHGPGSIHSCRHRFSRPLRGYGHRFGHPFAR